MQKICCFYVQCKCSWCSINSLCPFKCKFSFCDCRQGSQWKKYPLPLDGVYQSPVKTAHPEKPELRRGKSDLGDKSLEKLNKSPVISSKSKNLERSSRSGEKNHPSVFFVARLMENINAAGKEEKSRRSSSQQTPESMSSQQAISRMSPYTSSRLASSNYMHVAKKSSSSSGSSSGGKNNKLNNEDSAVVHQVKNIGYLDSI